MPENIIVEFRRKPFVTTPEAVRTMSTNQLFQFKGQPLVHSVRDFYGSFLDEKPQTIYLLEQVGSH